MQIGKNVLTEPKYEPLMCCLGHHDIPMQQSSIRQVAFAPVGTVVI